MPIDIWYGYAAVRVGRYWVGIYAVNQWCKPLRTTVEAALRDARKALEEK